MPHPVIIAFAAALFFSLLWQLAQMTGWWSAAFLALAVPLAGWGIHSLLT